MEKLDWLNGEYIRKIPISELRKRSLPWFEKSGLLKDRVTDLYLEKALKLARERVHTLAELPEASAYFFGGPPEYDATLLVWKDAPREQTIGRLERLHAFFIIEGEWVQEILEQRTKSLIETEALGVGETLWPLRVALTGRKASPSPFEIASVLGKEKTLARIKHAIKKLS